MLKDFLKGQMPSKINNYAEHIISDTCSEISELDYSKEILNNTRQNDEHKCGICKDEHSKETRIILSCEHTFHIKCIVNKKSTLAYVDEDALKDFKCFVCNKQMDFTEISFIYNKFLMNSKITIEEFDNKIKKLDDNLNIIKNELRNCYEIKKQLEVQKENAKQIVLTISTIL